MYLYKVPDNQFGIVPVTVAWTGFSKLFLIEYIFFNL